MMFSVQDSTIVYNRRTLPAGCSAQFEVFFGIVQCCFLGSLWRFPCKFFEGMKS
jgi:hypothetical protein